MSGHLSTYIQLKYVYTSNFIYFKMAIVIVVSFLQIGWSYQIVNLSKATNYVTIYVMYVEY